MLPLLDKRQPKEGLRRRVRPSKTGGGHSPEFPPQIEASTVPRERFVRDQFMIS